MQPLPLCIDHNGGTATTCRRPASSPVNRRRAGVTSPSVSLLPPHVTLKPSQTVGMSEPLPRPQAPRQNGLPSLRTPVLAGRWPPGITDRSSLPNPLGVRRLKCDARSSVATTTSSRGSAGPFRSRPEVLARGRAQLHDLRLAGTIRTAVGQTHRISGGGGIPEIERPSLRRR